ncbi:MAG: hypothetical protein ACD_45C00186G0001 [uncultured bacterium]|nr:MAG: hypothetical protein ACD_45C00186G0001 [uncultured bacterium]OGT55960.1 MAG: hypothetical protein A3F43_02885 [Gammaproteobacteria bacterium RIFCSPHIGHO2_12_FULL_42_10]
MHDQQTSVFKQNTLAVLLFSLGYLLVLAYFNYVDPYHHAFFESGLTVVLYNCARLFFIVYLIWMFYIPGDLFLRWMSGIDYRPLSMTSALLAFFAGVGIWHIVLLLMGFFGWYVRILMMGMTLSLFAISLPRLNQWMGVVANYRKEINWPGFLILLLPVLFFLMTKGLYPAGGGHDYYDHYFPYYLRVVERGNILPNEVWYHFYYSKGDGLFFLSMLLADPLSPQLATTAFMVAGAGVVFSILKTSYKSMMPWMGVALYFTFLIYTPGPVENMDNGGWANLEKAHEPSSVLMLAMIWMSIGLIKNNLPRLYGMALLLTGSALILIHPYSIVFAAPYFGMATVLFYKRHHRMAAFWSLLTLIVMCAWSLFFCLVNWLLTGIPEEQALLVYWPFIDFNKVNAWGVLLDIFKLQWDRIGRAAGNEPLFSLSFLSHLLSYLRLDVWGPLLLLTVSLFLIRIKNADERLRIFRTLDKASICAFAGFLSCVILVSALISRNNGLSYYRFTIFSYAPMLCLCLLVLGTVLQSKRLNKAWLIFGFAMACFVLSPFMNYQLSRIHRVLSNAAQFAVGNYSIAAGYEHPRGLPGQEPWGGIYPASRVIWSILPLKTRVWSMHVHSYCMLPDCQMESYPSYRLSKHEAVIYYGDPMEAKAVLKKEKLNYFFFSNVLELTDPLPLMPLFSPEHIADYFGVAWTNGIDTLLTWKEDAQSPLDRVWLQNYRSAVNHSKTVIAFPFAQMKDVLESTKVHYA